MKEISEIFQHLKALLRKKKDIEEIKEDFQEFLEDLKEEEAITSVEEELLLNIINLKELELGDFLLPRPDIVWFEQGMTWQEVKNILAMNPHHYFPVYSGTEENYLGYVSLKDLVRGINLEEFNWFRYVRPALTLPKSLSIIPSLEKMRMNSVEMVFVVDENSEFIGIVLLKDIIDEVFLVKEQCVAQTEEGGFILPGKTKLRVVERCFNLKFPEGDYHTLAGLIMEHYKGIPQAGTKISFDTFDVEILDADERRIKLVKLKPKA
jgi:CBS domain containing-hemolysin-like protein